MASRALWGVGRGHIAWARRRAYRPEMQFPFARDGRLFVIAGPCVIESAELCLDVARQVKAICDELGIFYVFKASFDKANRSSAASFRGPGLADGLVILKRVRDEI